MRQRRGKMLVEEREVIKMGKRILALAVLLLASAASAEQLKFSWSYTTADQAAITGFKLYRDGTVLEPVAIPATAREVAVARQTDKRSHTYYLTAYSPEDESKPSAIAIDAYVAAVVQPITGALTIEVVK